MTDLVYDFKDIASRMKGELKQDPEPMEETIPCPPAPNWGNILNRPLCPPCNGSGVDPRHGGNCQYCYGKGVRP